MTSMRPRRSAVFEALVRRPSDTDRLQPPDDLVTQWIGERTTASGPNCRMSDASRSGSPIGTSATIHP